MYLNCIAIILLVFCGDFIETAPQTDVIQSSYHHEVPDIPEGTSFSDVVEGGYGNVCKYIKPSTSLDFYIVDLSHQIGPIAATLPFFPKYNFTTLGYSVNRRYNIWIEEYYVGLPEHINTHVDSPSHMYRGRPFMHEVPMQNLVGPGVIIDVRRKALINPLYTVTIGDLMDWEDRYGTIPDGAVVIMNSGWHFRYPEPKYVFNTDHPENTQSFRYPTWSAKAVDWLIKNRQVIAVGVDTPTMDSLHLDTRPVHRILFRDCVPALEGVAYLHNIPPSGATIFIPPLKLYTGSGSPARIFATVPKVK